MLDAFRAMGVTGQDTMRKVVSFFLSAAKYAGVSVSRHWKTPAVSSSPRKPRTPGTGQGPPAAGGVPAVSSEVDTKPNERSVTLSSGAVVTRLFPQTCSRFAAMTEALSSS